MKRIFLLLFALSLALSPYAQKKQSSSSNKTTTSQSSSSSKKKKSSSTDKSAQSAKSSKTNKKQTSSKSKAQQSKKNRKGDAVTYTNSAIKGLQGQRASIQKKIKEQERALKENQANVKKRLQDLMVINGEIDQQQKNIEGIQSDIQHIEGNIGMLNSQLETLEKQLKERRSKYIRSMRYMSRHRSVQDRLMFIFSAGSLTQMYRRLSFVRQYAAFQKAQGEAVKAKQKQVNDKHQQLQTAKGHKNNLLYKGQQEKTALEGKQTEQQQMVQGLQKQQKTIQAVIADQRKKDAAINAQIDALIAQEVEKARARAAAEAKRKAEALAAAKKRAEDLARRKAAAEAAARENARRIEEAKRREAAAEETRRKAAEEARKALEEARKAEQEARAKAAEQAKSKEQERARAKAEAAAREAQERASKQAAAEQAARKAEADRQAAELKARADEARRKKEISDAKQEAQEASTLSSVDRMVSGGFEANRGRLPMPITGQYKIVSHFGQYNVQGLSGVTLDNKGINILGKSGCVARSIYDGEVSAVFGYGGMWNVLVRHGAYISVYCNLKSVSVHKGQKVSTRQALGAVADDNILQFQLRKETAKLNPEVWLGR